MIIEPAKPNLNKVIEAAEYIHRGGKISCGHDFWDKKINLGDIVLCTCCNQYFAKISGLPWVSKPQDYGHFTEPARTNHLDDVFYVPVPARISTSGYTVC